MASRAFNPYEPKAMELPLLATSRMRPFCAFLCFVLLGCNILLILRLPFRECYGNYLRCQKCVVCLPFSKVHGGTCYLLSLLSPPPPLRSLLPPPLLSPEPLLSSL